MTDMPTLRGPARAMILFLALGLAAILVVSLTERFKNPHLTVQAQQRGMPAQGSDEGHGVGKLMQQVAQNPNDLGLLVHLIESLIGAQNWDAAETFAQRAVTLDVNNPQPLYLLGIVMHNLGRHKEAAEALEKVLVLRDEASVRYSLGVLCIYFLKDTERGRVHLKAGLQDPKASADLRQAISQELEKNVQSQNDAAAEDKKAKPDPKKDVKKDSPKDGKAPAGGKTTKP